MKVRNTKGIANPQFKTSGLQIRWNRGNMKVRNTKGIANPQFKTSGLQIRWNRETMGKLIKDGINPGYPVYQPFK